jgi:hypothetical protein
MVMSTRYSADGDVDVLPKITNWVFEILRIEFFGISTRPRGSSIALKLWRSTSKSASVAIFVELYRFRKPLGRERFGRGLAHDLSINGA